MALPNYEKNIVSDISVTSYLKEGSVNAYKIGDLIIVKVFGSMEDKMPDIWTDYPIAKLNGVKASTISSAPIVDQATGLCADLQIEENSDTININKRAVSTIMGEWIRGELIFKKN